MREHNDPLQSLREAVATLTDVVQSLERKTDAAALEFKRKTDKLQEGVDATREGVEFIKMVKTGGKVMKWLAVFLASVGVIWAALKGMLAQIIIGFQWR